MSELIWNPDDVLQCLAVVPEVEKYETKYRYEVADDDLTLNLTIWPLESEASFSLMLKSSSTPVFDFYAFIQDGIVYQLERGSDSLLLRNCVIAPRSDYFEYRQKMNSRAPFIGVHIELSAYPNIILKLRGVSDQ